MAHSNDEDYESLVRGSTPYSGAHVLCYSYVVVIAYARIDMERKTELISVRIDRGLIEWVDGVAEYIGTSRSAAIRTILGYVRDLDCPDDPSTKSHH